MKSTYASIYTKWLSDFNSKLEGIEVSRMGIISIFIKLGDEIIVYTSYTPINSDWEIKVNKDCSVIIPKGLTQEELYLYVDNFILNTEAYQNHLVKRKLKDFLDN